MCNGRDVPQRYEELVTHCETAHKNASQYLPTCFAQGSRSEAVHNRVVNLSGKSLALVGRLKQQDAMAPDHTMAHLDLPPPDWNALVGGGEEWIWVIRRVRDFGSVAELASHILELARTLEDRELLFHCTPNVLREMPLSVDWYLCLAGFSTKTLRHMVVRPANAGLLSRPSVLAERLRRGRVIPDDQLQTFADWLNLEIAFVWPSKGRDQEFATAVVLLTFAERIAKW